MEAYGNMCGKDEIMRWEGVFDEWMMGVALLFELVVKRLQRHNLKTQHEWRNAPVCLIMYLCVRLKDGTAVVGKGQVTRDFFVQQ